MGNWHIAIDGMGMHHNPNDSRDANKMASEFVQSLKKAGHSIYQATFTHGGADFLVPDDTVEKDVDSARSVEANG